MLRTTLIRGGLLTLFALLGAALWWAQSYVRPEAVRATLIESFQEQFPDAHIHVGEAHLKVFGGVSVRDLALARDGDSEPFFRAPNALIAHDKEELSSGRMIIRRIELDGASLRIERRKDGRWSFDGLTRPSPADRPLPMFVVKNGHLTFTDKTQPALPPIVFSEANFQIINDPPPLHLQVKGSALLSVSHPGMTLPPLRVELLGRVHRLTGEFSFRVNAPDITLGADLINLLKAWKPEAAEALASFTAKASVKLEIGYKPEAPQPYTWDCEMKLRDGAYSHPLLPKPIEGLEATIRYREGKISIEKATAKLGASPVELSLDGRVPVKPVPEPPSNGLVPGTLTSTVRKQTPSDPFAELEDKLERIELTVKELPLDDTIFTRLGDEARDFRKRFEPVGSASVSYRFSRQLQGWKRELEVKPGKLGFTYENFRYPLHDVIGVIRRTSTQQGKEETRVELTGTVGGQRVDIKGVMSGGGPDPALEIRITGNNIPIDDRLFDALYNPKHREALKKLRARGRADLAVDVKQDLNVNRTDSTIRVIVYDGELNHTSFPYPLSNVCGTLVISVASSDETRPFPKPEPEADRIVLSDFTGRHGSGTVKFKGMRMNVPNSADQKFTINMTGQSCPIDDDLKAALTAMKIDGVWRTFSPRGTITFAVDVELMDRAAAVPSPVPMPFNPHRPPGLLGTLTARPKSMPGATAAPPTFNPATDLLMTINFTGPSVTPDFFPYDLDAVSGRVRYDGTQVRFEKFTAKHGTSQWVLDAGEVRFFDDGRVWANIGRLDVTPLILDSEFLAALPPTLNKAAKEINLRGGAEMTLRHLVVLTPKDILPKPAPELLQDPDMYWTGEIRLKDAALDAGIAWEHITGRIATTGRYYGTHLGDVVGTVWLDEALVEKHPLTNVKIGYRADPQTLDPKKPGQYESVAVRLLDLNGNFFGGTLGGEGRVILSDPVQYRLRLDAAEVKLEELARHHELNKTARVEGTAQASLRLETVPDGKGGYLLDGAGSFDVDRGHMLNLPFLLPLLKTLKLQAPDKTAFEEAHAAVVIRGSKVYVTHLDLVGDALSIGGSGETDFQGKDLQFDCFVIWSQTLHRWLTTPLGDLSAFVSEKLFRIEIKRGPDGQIKYDARIVPFVTDPFRLIADRFKKKKSPMKVTTQ